MVVFGTGPATAQALNIVLGSMVVVLVVLAGRDLLTSAPDGGMTLPHGYARGVGIVAASATMVAGQQVFSSVVVMAAMGEESLDKRQDAAPGEPLAGLGVPFEIQRHEGCHTAMALSRTERSRITVGRMGYSCPD